MGCRKRGGDTREIRTGALTGWGVVDTGEHRRAFQAHRRCKQRLGSGVGTRRIATALLLSAHPLAAIDFVCILTSSPQNSPLSPFCR